MKTGWRIAFAVAGILFGIGLIKYLMQGPRGEAIALRDPPTPMPIQVFVSGGVKIAGVYTIPVGSRVQDAIEAAGGFSPEADLEGLNLAAYVQDGERILVPLITQVPEVSKSTVLELPNDTPSVNKTALININTADQLELESLPGIGPVLAQEIIAYRESNGTFKDVEEILNVKGIGTAKYEQIRNLITIGDLP